MACASGMVCAAEQAAATDSLVRYHFGDDADGKLGWAKANFDDSAWPVAQDGRWPGPAFDSDGFVWVRFHVPVRSDTAGPLAMRVFAPQAVLAADEVFVNGRLVGRFGRTPPDDDVESVPRAMVFDVPGRTDGAGSDGGCGVTDMVSAVCATSRRTRSCEFCIRPAADTAC